jgi:hypothetical protein
MGISVFVYYLIVLSIKTICHLVHLKHNVYDKGELAIGYVMYSDCRKIIYLNF